MKSTLIKNKEEYIMKFKPLEWMSAKMIIVWKEYYNVQKQVSNWDLKMEVIRYSEVIM